MLHLPVNPFREHLPLVKVEQSSYFFSSVDLGSSNSLEAAGGGASFVSVNNAISALDEA